MVSGVVSSFIFYGFSPQIQTFSSMHYDSKLYKVQVQLWKIYKERKLRIIHKSMCLNASGASILTTFLPCSYTCILVKTKPKPYCSFTTFWLTHYVVFFKNVFFMDRYYIIQLCHKVLLLILRHFNCSHVYYHKQPFT